MRLALAAVSIALFCVAPVQAQTQQCSLKEGRQVLQFASTSKVEPRSWKRATSVEVMPIKLCKSARENIEKIFAASGKIVDLQKAIAADEAVVAALEGAKREVADVFAVFLSEGKLTVYVY